MKYLRLMLVIRMEIQAIVSDIHCCNYGKMDLKKQTNKKGPYEWILS